MTSSISPSSTVRQVCSLLQRAGVTLPEKARLRTALRRAPRWVLLFAVLFLIGSLLPEGFDWVHYYKAGRLHPIWTPWTYAIIRWVTPPGYGLVFALTIIGLGVRAHRYNRSPVPLALALFSMPTAWVIFMGNLDGLVLFGMLVMPWGVPLVLMKPQISAFALLARRSWLAAGAAWLLLSLVLWGLWPVRLFMVGTPEWRAEWVQDIALFPWGLLLGLPLLWFSRRDEDLLMAAGSLITPHLFPYHFILLMPALGRMRPAWMWLTWLVSWSILLVNWLGPWAWHLGNLLSLCFWFGIALNRPAATTNLAAARPAPAAAEE